MNVRGLGGAGQLGQGEAGFAQAMKIETLKRSTQFKRVRGGVRWAGPLFIIEGRLRAEGDGRATGAGSVQGPRFGFTITRKVGGAVIRNRIRRRLKEAIRGLSSPHMRPDHDYVVVASRATHDYPFAGLQAALGEAFERLHKQADGRPGRVKQVRQRARGERDIARLQANSKLEAVPPGGADGCPESPPQADVTRPGSTPSGR